jgi:hypothetical protein
MGDIVDLGGIVEDIPVDDLEDDSVFFLAWTPTDVVVIDDGSFIKATSTKQNSPRSLKLPGKTTFIFPLGSSIG